MTLKERVKKLLLNNPEYRDNDLPLCNAIWQEDCKKIGMNFDRLSAIEFLALMEHKAISKHQSILRARRDVNYKNIETVGKSYKGISKSLKPVVKTVEITKKPIHPLYSLCSQPSILCPTDELIAIHSLLHSLPQHPPQLRK